MEKNDINININSTDKKEPIYTHTLKLFTKTIAEAKWSKILKVYFVAFFSIATLLGAYYAYRVVSDAELLRIATNRMSSSTEGEDIRDFVVTPKIQHELEILVYTLNAERAFIFELHNGKKNTSGLPFRFADMTYEVVNDEKKVDKVAMQFQDIPLTLYKYPHYLQKQKTMIGTVEEIETVDEDYAGHIKDIGGKYLGMTYMSSDGTPIGFLCVSYHDLNGVPSKDLINQKLSEYSKMLTSLLDLRTHAEKKLLKQND